MMPAMNHHACRLTAHFLRAAAPACLLLAACDPTDDPSAAGRSRYRAPMPEPRRTAHPDPDNARWLAAWRDLRTRLAPLQERLASAQKFHSEHQFDSFLDLDPETL